LSGVGDCVIWGRILGRSYWSQGHGMINACRILDEGTNYKGSPRQGGVTARTLSVLEA
jgi:hypothetical protein